MTTNSLYSMSKFVGSRVPSFWQVAAQKGAWIGSDWQAAGPKWSMDWHRLASRSLFYIITSLIGHTDMKWSSINWYGAITTNGLLFVKICWQCAKLLASCQPQMEHGLAKIGQQEPVSYHNITHWTHMDYMKWSSINWYGDVTTNSL
jgi:hypothetical protein